MQWTVTHGNILNEPAHVLVCSANVFLTLSGGVGGSLLQQFGPRLQDELNTYLVTHGVRHVPRGTVIVTQPPDVPWRGIIHAVAVDGMYETSPEVIAQVVAESLRSAAMLDAKYVALTALATGFGKLTLRQFARGIASLGSTSFGSVERVSIVVRHEHEADELHAALEAGLA